MPAPRFKPRWTRHSPRWRRYGHHFLALLWIFPGRFPGVQLCGVDNVGRVLTLVYFTFRPTYSGDGKTPYVDENHPMKHSLQEQGRKAELVREIATDLRRRVDDFASKRGLNTPARVLASIPNLSSIPSTGFQRVESDDPQKAQLQLLSSLQKAETQISELHKENGVLRARCDEKQYECKRLEQELKQTRDVAVEVRFVLFLLPSIFFSSAHPRLRTLDPSLPLVCMQLKFANDTWAKQYALITDESNKRLGLLEKVRREFRTRAVAPLPLLLSSA
jgi:hypothetical protein